MINRDPYRHGLIESKWQIKWKKSAVYTPKINAKNKFYNLMMFPYPSAEGLHIGNMYAFTGADVNGRYQRMLGHSVFEPIGLDGFGIHSENYAIKKGIHPKKLSEITEKRFYSQLTAIGGSFDWTRKLETYDPDYYRWTQWIFIKMYEKGLVYRGEAMVNWCPSCKTVLADEQAESGICERCKTKVERRIMASWYFRITDYAEKLLSGLETINWPEKIKHAQRQWIGKSQGMVIKFQLVDHKSQIAVFTTRPDTIHGATFLVISPELSKKYLKFVPKGKREKVLLYINKSLSKTEQERKLTEKKKTGVDMGLEAINPITNKKISVWVADYVLSDVGTGAIMGVPAHDERDMKFARKYKIDIVEMEPDEKMWEEIKKRGLGQKTTTYHLRDWLVSRQRYWGAPIPMINCKKCGWLTVPEEDLPVELPDIKDYKPKADGTSPLSNAPDSWKFVECPKCGGKAQRELDVSDTFLDSSWYFLAYPNLDTRQWKEGPSASSGQAFFDKKIMNAWLPVDAYIGGAEHAVLHLLYSRFVTRALSDMGYLDFKEPFPFLYGHGLIIKDGAKMSKSRGNVVNPDEYIKKYGADTVRMYLMFLGPFDQGGDFSDAGIEGMERFTKRVWNLLSSADHSSVVNHQLSVVMHQTIKKVTNDLERFRYNTAISTIMEYVNFLRISDPLSINHYSLIVLAQLIAPFAPYMAEEAWELLGEKYSIHTSNWPKYDPEMVREDKAVYAIQVNGKLRGEITVPIDESKEKVIKKAKEDERIVKWLEEKVIEKEIFVKGKIVNFVLSVA
ncbi:MAG: Leucine-tRNA ligase [Candidatus Woesebacteria bacterium GW2011_GWB1_43_14]|uniref:Leucine--tRNA ligase n=1 Tax=Candidatus Woesebacteria bacterium GW2011_GWB1_43_14 TaxID=1618578 RepID=A0A0G1DH24_9BACT|nr:MAG: Leucine-tRNA ligase [Candidatus Woesebacteria bacterium GW2011_GWC1_42_9]KKS96882.1 MAG: Leucine-tRNA ligase [Candidatus Woesebacteria bacterium GW2011_GWB1_43_14]